MNRTIVLFAIAAAAFVSACDPTTEQKENVARDYDSLLGTWIVDPAASLESMTTDPKWDEQAARFAPRILKRMSKVHFEFGNDEVAYFEGGDDAIRFSIAERAERDGFVSLSVANADMEETLSIRFEGDVIAIEPSGTNDMRHYRWTRGLPDPETFESDLAIALDIVLTGIGESKAPAE